MIDLSTSIFVNIVEEYTFLGMIEPNDF